MAKAVETHGKGSADHATLMAAMPPEDLREGDTSHDTCRNDGDAIMPAQQTAGERPVFRQERPASDRHVAPISCDG